MSNCVRALFIRRDRGLAKTWSLDKNSLPVWTVLSFAFQDTTGNAFFRTLNCVEQPREQRFRTWKHSVFISWRGTKNWILNAALSSMLWIMSTSLPIYCLYLITLMVKMINNFNAWFKKCDIFPKMHILDGKLGSSGNWNLYCLVPCLENMQSFVWRSVDAVKMKDWLGFRCQMLIQEI